MTQPLNVPTITPDAELEAQGDDLTTFPVTHDDHPEAGAVLCDGRAWPAMKADGWKRKGKGKAGEAAP